MLPAGLPALRRRPLTRPRPTSTSPRPAVVARRSAPSTSRRRPPRSPASSTTYRPELPSTPAARSTARYLVANPPLPLVAPRRLPAARRRRRRPAAALGPLAAAPAVAAGHRGHGGARRRRGRHPHHPLGPARRHDHAVWCWPPARRAAVSCSPCSARRSRAVAPDVDETPPTARHPPRWCAGWPSTRRDRRRRRSGAGRRHRRRGRRRRARQAGRRRRRPADAGLLSGRTHLVHTGVAVRRAAGIEVEVVTTDVTMTPITPEAIEWYVGTGEPLDKAGAYAHPGRRRRVRRGDPGQREQRGRAPAGHRRRACSSRPDDRRWWTSVSTLGVRLLTAGRRPTIGTRTGRVLTETRPGVRIP